MRRRRRNTMLWALVALLLLLWIGGFALHVVGAFVHVLLIVAIVVAIAAFFTGRRGSTAV